MSRFWHCSFHLVLLSVITQHESHSYAGNVMPLPKQEPHWQWSGLKHLWENQRTFGSVLLETCLQNMITQTICWFMRWQTVQLKVFPFNCHWIKSICTIFCKYVLYWQIQLRGIFSVLSCSVSLFCCGLGITVFSRFLYQSKELFLPSHYSHSFSCDWYSSERFCIVVSSPSGSSSSFSLLLKRQKLDEVHMPVLSWILVDFASSLNAFFTTVL